MGEVIRRYWLPTVLSKDLPTIDSNPVRVRLMGEDLIAYRDTGGRVGLLGDHCPHRGASLFFGRNEEAGLRCVYHGWKFDVSGACVDMPNEPPESNFKDKIHHTAYPCAEWGDVVWTYMGPRATPPGLPRLEWAAMPAAHRRFPWRAIRQCNWVQAMEGDLDTSHPYFLHARLKPEDDRAYGLYHPDHAPKLYVLDSDVGVMYASRRQESESTYYWRVTQYLMPNITMFPADANQVVPGHMWVPMDDENTLIWCFAWSPTRPFTPTEMAGDSLSGEKNELWRPNNGPGELLPYQAGRPYASSWPLADGSNDYLIDRQVQRERNFTGIPFIPLQDDAVTTSMGAITDRSAEHLGTADAMIIRVRRRLLSAMRSLEDEGTTPPGVDKPELYRRRSSSTTLPMDADWVEALRDWHEARTSTLAH
jgi:nitrite reductase/ring-hydroxylating ferredoxin subunit